MTSPGSVCVAGLGLWLPRHPGVAAWTSSAPVGAIGKPLGATLDRTNRRRASQLCRAIADAAAEAMADADVDPATIPSIIGSSIAEASTMLGLLDQIWRQRVPMSPAAFTMSVHNAASGLISISHGNRGFTTSLAADEDTPAAALLEGVALVQTTGQPVLVACGDEASPEHLVPIEMAWDMLAGAVVLAPVDWPGPRRARLRIARGAAATVEPAALEQDLGRNPQAGLADLVDAIARGRSGVVALDRGTGRGYRAEVVALHGSRPDGELTRSAVQPPRASAEPPRGPRQ